MDAAAPRAMLDHEVTLGMEATPKTRDGAQSVEDQRHQRHHAGTEITTSSLFRVRKKQTCFKLVSLGFQVNAARPNSSNQRETEVLVFQQFSYYSRKLLMTGKFQVDYSQGRNTSVIKSIQCWGAWVAQSVEHPTLAQVMILRFVSSGPASGSVLTSRSLQPASNSVSPSLSLPLPCSYSASLCLSKINKC